MAKINKHLVTIYIPVIVVVVVAVIVGAVLIASASGGFIPIDGPQYASSHVEPRAGQTHTATATRACEFSDLIGRALSSLDVSAYAPRAIRVLHPGSMVTMDYSEFRINITVDRNDTITRVTCG